ncbi:MAG: hypothetical protein ACOZQL_32865 [Myxococcota bacterium]
MALLFGVVLGCTRPAGVDAGRASPLVVREPGGSGGDFFTFAGSPRRVQALDCGVVDGGAWCIERVGPSLRRALVQYRWRGTQLVGELDHLADAGEPPCTALELPSTIAVHELPSRRVSYSRTEGPRAVAGDGRPIASLDAGTSVLVVQRAVDADGAVWLELSQPLGGWIPLDCPPE